eukprot:CAMPEP_0183463524 /NCGR_PEP_ID=MMETSP0370-20130417/143700_1 /TAXON_ID=268820 /ORGANISM="Peridinium aciculiferum, Strain PAER-2" /LENGTH=239 /DNA_ID=CAMNT_0025655645 /DNA_START=24 /DNA_END=741 /DNA_ORIENTATION=-
MVDKAIRRTMQSAKRNMMWTSLKILWPYTMMIKTRSAILPMALGSLLQAFSALASWQGCAQNTGAAVEVSHRRSRHGFVGDRFCWPPIGDIDERGDLRFARILLVHYCKRHVDQCFALWCVGLTNKGYLVATCKDELLDLLLFSTLQCHRLSNCCPDCWLATGFYSRFVDCAIFHVPVGSMVGGRELRSAGEGVGTEDRAHGSDSRRGQMSGAAVSIQDCVSCDLHNVALRMSIFVVFD